MFKIIGIFSHGFNLELVMVISDFITSMDWQKKPDSSLKVSGAECGFKSRLKSAFSAICSDQCKDFLKTNVIIAPR